MMIKETNKSSKENVNIILRLNLVFFGDGLIIVRMFSRYG